MGGPAHDPSVEVTGDDATVNVEAPETPEPEATPEATPEADSSSSTEDSKSE